VPITFPPAAATLSGDVLSINRYLNMPLIVLRDLRTLLEQMFVSDKILTGQLYTESGSVLYETGETIFADKSATGVQPLSEYPITPITLGDASMANTVKWGQDALVSDESISRSSYDVLRRGFQKLTNSHVQKIDSVALSAVASAVTQNTNAIASWAGTGTTPFILRDLMRAYANIVNLKMGYIPDTVLCGLTTFANVVSDTTLLNLLPREVPGVGSSGVEGGWKGPYMRQIGGFNFITSPNLPTTGVATLLDSSVLGAFVDERLPAPGYVGGENGLQVKTIRTDKEDGWRIRARRITVPIIREPAAAWKINLVDA
jgi:hypothetical protein